MWIGAFDDRAIGKAVQGVPGHAGGHGGLEDVEAFD
jgi:hypothetical protein